MKRMTLAILCLIGVLWAVLTPPLPVDASQTDAVAHCLVGHE